MRIAAYGIPLKVLNTFDEILPVVTPGSDVSLYVMFTTEETGDITLSVYLEREYNGEYLPVTSWPDLPLSLIPGNTSYGGSGSFRKTMVNTGLWRWRIRWTDDVGVQEISTYYQVQDAIQIPSTTMVKSSIGGCVTTPSTSVPKLSVIQGNNLDVQAFLYDEQGNPYIGLSGATDGEIRLISQDTRLVSGHIPFSDLVFDDPELGDGSLKFSIPRSITEGLESGTYRVYLEVSWVDKILEWPKLFDLNVLKQRV